MLTRRASDQARCIVRAGGLRELTPEAPASLENSVWIGYREFDEEKTVRPVTIIGYDEGYVTGAKMLRRVVFHAKFEPLRQGL